MARGETLDRHLGAEERMSWASGGSAECELIDGWDISLNQRLRHSGLNRPARRDEGEGTHEDHGD